VQYEISGVGLGNAAAELRMNSPGLMQGQGQRGMNIITGSFAVNTDAADLSGYPPYQKITPQNLIGGRKTGGHGWVKSTSLAPR